MVYESPVNIKIQEQFLLLLQNTPFNSIHFSIFEALRKPPLLQVRTPIIALSKCYYRSVLQQRFQKPIFHSVFQKELLKLRCKSPKLQQMQQKHQLYRPFRVEIKQEISPLNLIPSFETRHRIRPPTRQQIHQSTTYNDEPQQRPVELNIQNKGHDLSS